MLLAPTLHHAAPVNQPQYGGWATPYVARIIGLTILDRMGLPWFQHLPVLTFARRDPDGALYTYSYRLWRNFAAHGDYAEDFRRAPAPPAVLVGSADELFIADAYTPLIASIRPDSKVLVLPELTHMDMTYHPDAWRAVAALLRE
jgi:pimeloyl-ACP methyl ester carboxylesterase